MYIYVYKRCWVSMLCVRFPCTSRTLTHKLTWLRHLPLYMLTQRIRWRIQQLSSNILYCKPPEDGHQYWPKHVVEEVHNKTSTDIGCVRRFLYVDWYTRNMMHNPIIKLSLSAFMTTFFDIIYNMRLIWRRKIVQTFGRSIYLVIWHVIKVANLYFTCTPHH
jgi:hypothetical protein